ncbi:hypothetical protein BT69DRAFT_521725 [Atractiella rhizophila]|nr:hypothetical protein BT69DRAFT_521725 [Atractiella rhizophila]
MTDTYAKTAAKRRRRRAPTPPFPLFKPHFSLPRSLLAMASTGDIDSGKSKRKRTEVDLAVKNNEDGTAMSEAKRRRTKKEFNNPGLQQAATDIQSTAAASKRSKPQNFRTL